LARSLRATKIVVDISPQTVQRILMSHQLKPWRVHHWLSPKVPHDDGFRLLVENIRDLYTRDLGPHERVFSLDEKTSLQPRPRSTETLPPLPAPKPAPVRVEHEYKRCGALNLFGAFDTRSGEVIGISRRRKRQIEFIELLEKMDKATPSTITVIHVLCDNVSIHHGKKVKAWLAMHPRFKFHFTPVHCSWMNQIEQWFSILQRKRMVASNFADLAALEERVLAFINEWNQIAHPFAWTRASFDKILAKVQSAIPPAA
jgi:hypothetical protein